MVSSLVRESGAEVEMGGAGSSPSSEPEAPLAQCMGTTTNPFSHGFTQSISQASLTFRNRGIEKMKRKFELVNGTLKEKKDNDNKRSESGKKLEKV